MSADEKFSIQARRASECVQLAHQQMHALAGASGLYCTGTLSPAGRLMNCRESKTKPLHQR